MSPESKEIWIHQDYAEDVKEWIDGYTKFMAGVRGMTEFEKARDRVAFENEIHDDCDHIEFKAGADWAYGWQQKRIDNLKQALIYLCEKAEDKVDWKALEMVSFALDQDDKLAGGER